MLQIIIRANKPYTSSLENQIKRKYSNHISNISIKNDANTRITFKQVDFPKILIIHSSDWWTHIVKPIELHNIYVIEFSEGDKERNCKGSSLQSSGKYTFLEYANKDKLIEVTYNILDGILKEGINYKIVANIKVAYSLCSQILTPFILLHTGLQMEKEGIKVFSNMSDEEKGYYKKVCEDGLELLKDNDQKIKAKFMELLGLSNLKWDDIIKNESHLVNSVAKDFDTFLRDFGTGFKALFEVFVSDKEKNIDNIVKEYNCKNRIKLEREGEKDLDLIEAIEELAKIAEDAIAYKEISDSIRSFRHDSENTSKALSGYIKNFENNKPDSRKNLQGLDSGLISKLMDRLPAVPNDLNNHTWNMVKKLITDIKNAVKNASVSYNKMRASLFSQDETAFNEQIRAHGKGVINQLKDAESLTLQIAPKMSTYR